MAAAKTTAERQREFKEKKKRLGLKEVSGLWAHKDDHNEIKRYVQMLEDRRTKGSRSELSLKEELWGPVRDVLLIGGELPNYARRKDGGLELRIDGLEVIVGDETILKYYLEGKLFISKTIRPGGFEYMRAPLADDVWFKASFPNF